MRQYVAKVWRRERDLNPRRCYPQRFSRPPQSAALPSLHGAIFLMKTGRLSTEKKRAPCVPIRKACLTQRPRQMPPHKPLRSLRRGERDLNHGSAGISRFRDCRDQPFPGFCQTAGAKSPARGGSFSTRGCQMMHTIKSVGGNVNSTCYDGRLFNDQMTDTIKSPERGRGAQRALAWGRRSARLRARGSGR